MPPPRGAALVAESRFLPIRVVCPGDGVRRVEQSGRDVGTISNRSGTHMPRFAYMEERRAVQAAISSRAAALRSD